MKIITDYLENFRIIFNNPSYRHFQRLVMGFVSNTGPTAITEINDSKNSDKHFSTIYDFLKGAKWSHIQLAQLLFYWFMTQVSQHKRPILCIDDTKAFKPHARKIPDLSWHADHHHRVKTRVKSSEGEELTATGVVGYKGHCWVVLAALHKLKPGKWCCFPILGDIFVRKKDTKNFRTKLEIAQDLISTLNYSMKPLLVGDNFYSAKDFVNHIEADVLSLLKPNAVAFEPPPDTDIRRRGRPRKYGRKVLLLKELNQNFEEYTVHVYGRQANVQVSQFRGLLRGHHRPVKIILVKGLRKDNFLLFTNDLKLSPKQMIEYYSARFQIEITFRELKQELGAFNYRLRSIEGVMRYVHLSFVAYALLKYLTIQSEIKPQKTDWYNPKSLPSPRRVQQVLNQKLQAFRIFKGLQDAGYLRKNISSDEFVAIAVS